MEQNLVKLYEDLVSLGTDHTEMNGRYIVQKDAERLIVRDIIDKLSIQPNDELLEIGCGVGTLLIPLSYMVKSTVGIDIEASVSEIKRRAPLSDIKCLPGLFPNTSPEGKFSKILIYGVVIYMKSEKECLDFIDEALTHLKSDGAMLIGDINCSGRKKRFSSGTMGKQFSKEWNRLMKNAPTPKISQHQGEYLEFTDEIVMNMMLHIRKKGWHTELRRQPSYLPFGHTREDLIVIGPNFNPENSQNS